jgi:cell division initiation protein
MTRTVLTPTAARGVTLPRSRRGGYDREETDRHLEAVLDSFEAVWRERESLLERVEELHHQVEGLQARLDEVPGELDRLQGELGEYRELERSMRQTLLAAQRSAEESKVAARKDSERALRKARAKAQRLLDDAKEKRDAMMEEAEAAAQAALDKTRAQRSKVEAEVEQLEQFADSTRQMLRQLLIGVLEHIERSNGNGAAPVPAPERARNGRNGTRLAAAK